MGYIGDNEIDSEGNPAFIDDAGVQQALFMAVLFIDGTEYQVGLSAEEFELHCELVEPQTSIVGGTDWSTKEESDLKEQFDMLSGDRDPPFKLDGHENIGKTFSYTGLHPKRPWGTFDMLESNNKPKSIKIGAGKKKEKINTGIYFDGRSGYRHFGWEVLGVTERIKAGNKGGVQQYTSIESQVSKRVAFAFGQRCIGGNGLGFTRHPDNLHLRSIISDERALFYLKNFEHPYCPGFFQNGRTLSGYLEKNDITTVEEFRTWQGELFPVLEKAYLHELNSRRDREHRKEYPDSEEDFDYVARLEDLPGGELDLEGPTRVDFYDDLMKDNNDEKKPAAKRNSKGGRGSSGRKKKQKKSKTAAASSFGIGDEDYSPDLPS